jgi:hypothetical protein
MPEHAKRFARNIELRVFARPKKGGAYVSSVRIVKPDFSRKVEPADDTVAAAKKPAAKKSAVKKAAGNKPAAGKAATKKAAAKKPAAKTAARGKTTARRTDKS